MHPFADLDAYLDGALDERRRTEVAAHVAGCSVCPARLAQLRATARLIHSLPSAEPARSLVPRLTVPFWLAPLRTLSAIASGLAVLAFAASTLITSAPTLPGAGGSAAVPAAGPAATNSERTDQKVATSSFSVGNSTAQPFGPAVPAPQASGTAGAATDTANRSVATQGTSAPAAAGSAAPTTQDAVALGEPIRREVTPPWVWLALALVFAAIAIALQRRLQAR